MNATNTSSEVALTRVSYSIFENECREARRNMCGVYYFISLQVRKCGFTHASRAEIRIFTPRDIKFRTILVRKNVFSTHVITSLAFGSCCKLTLVRKRFIALVS